MPGKVQQFEVTGRLTCLMLSVLTFDADGLAGVTATISMGRS